METVTWWIKALVFLIPLWWSGVQLLKYTLTDRRIELVYPLGLVFGIILLIFSVNIIAFIIKPSSGIYLGYLIVLFLGVLTYKKSRYCLELLDRKSLKIFLITAIFWLTLLLPRMSNLVVGGDPDFHYVIAKSFARGNFPIQTPWQPDLPLFYHYGASQFLGAMNLMTGISFEFLHAFTSLVILVSLVLVLVFLLKRIESYKDLILYQFIPFLSLVTCGAVFIVWPNLPLSFSEILQKEGLVSWVQNFPKGTDTYESYGGAVGTIYTMGYFYHYLLGMAGFVCALIIALKGDLIENRSFFWASLCTVLLSLALINETFFVVACVCVAVTIILRLESLNKLNSQLRYISGASIIFLVLLFIQGGILSYVLFPDPNHEKSVAYLILELIPHRLKQFLPLLLNKDIYKPFSWYHPGIIWIYFLIISAFAFLYLRKKTDQILAPAIFLLASIVSIVMYIIIVPQFVPANANRLISMSYQFAGLSLGLLVVVVIRSFTEIKKYIKVLLFTVILYMLLPIIVTYVSDLVVVKRSRNDLIYSAQSNLASTKWLSHQPYNLRVLSIVSSSIRSNVIRSITMEAGVFSPNFTSESRTYSFDLSPEHVDAIKTLNPDSLKSLGITHILIDKDSFSKIPEKRATQLNDTRYFEISFRDDTFHIFKIKPLYLQEGGGVEGTYKHLSNMAQKGRYYIDNEANFPHATDLRRTLLYALKDQDLYFNWDTGVYTNIESRFSGMLPSELVQRNKRLPQIKTLDFMVLYQNTDPQKVCDCRVEKLWQGVEDKIVLYKIIK